MSGRLPTTPADLFLRGYACSQAILATYGPAFGLDPAQGIRLFGSRSRRACARARPAGRRRVRSWCSAWRSAARTASPAKASSTVASAVSDFATSFRERLGSLDCPDIIGVDLRTPEGMKAANDEGLFASKCAPAVRVAAEILDEMLPGRTA